MGACPACIARIAELEELVRQMKEEMVPTISFPEEWNLLRGERQILSGLLRNDVFRVTQYRYFRIRQREGRDDIRNLSVRVYHIRKKLRPFVDITIENVFGIGYSISRRDKNKILALIKEGKEHVVQYNMSNSLVSFTRLHNQ